MVKHKLKSQHRQQKENGGNIARSAPPDELG
jgi:hypothetical protein